ncbi:MULTISPECIES: helix-turn-helix domain-containing protein [unclassified Micromonospora]|uniref:ArsR/SmtB family transcription factor n=1 Tax=unclassified Micromonospora TaxID=2617518 RepID=UPI00188F6BB9|nr:MULTISPECIES: helix-turn-helix domain-containing protein [unclassified Micromonospora]MBF5028530.1 helix-turn-helix transcriptional regulator [Micromonospora sp. ANENR4]MCZ7472997.1 helix-turn-helix domain-containing protein [Micromonospora sp. WMMC273]WBC03678.1 helix-turn-helix domain-containing protein [Micromonospora sp. WMMA1976]
MDDGDGLAGAGRPSSQHSFIDASFPDQRRKPRLVRSRRGDHEVIDPAARTGPSMQSDNTSGVSVGAAQPLPYDVWTGTTGDRQVQVLMDDATLGRIRIAFSPLWELAASLVSLRRGPHYMRWPFSDWARAAWQHFPPELAELYAVTAPQLPGFIAPIPDGSANAPVDELARSTATAPDEVRAEIVRLFPDEVPAPLVRFVADPDGSLRWYTDEVSRFWEHALASRWGAIRSVLDEELLLRSRMLATRGGASLLADLHGIFTWNPPLLEVPGTLGAVPSRDACPVLVPMMFARGLRMSATDSRGRIAIPFQARGASVLSDSPDLTRRLREDALTMLIGGGRASIMRAVVVPCTTSVLSRRLALAKSTVSEHLKTLHACGLVLRRRVGGQVLYELDQAGRSLLDLLDLC